MADKIIPPKELIEREGKVIRFNGLYDSDSPDDAVTAVESATPFKQSNKAGHVHHVDSVEEACIEGQLIAMDLKRIAKLNQAANSR